MTSGTIATFYVVDCTCFIGLYFRLSLTFLRANSEPPADEIAHTADVTRLSTNCGSSRIVLKF